MVELEIIKDKLGNYYATASKNGLPLKDIKLPNGVDYSTLKKAIKANFNADLPGVRALNFIPYWSKKCAKVLVNNGEVIIK